MEQVDVMPLGEAMEVYQALSLMFMFGIFIIALLNYLKKK
jgi:hypothetical protein